MPGKNDPQIWWVGHDDDGYSFILTIASSEEEAREKWRRNFSADEARGEALRGEEGEESRELYQGILSAGPTVCQPMGDTVDMDDGGYKICT